MITRIFALFNVLIAFSCRHNPEKTPAIPDSNVRVAVSDTLPLLLSQAKAQKKSLFLVFGFEKCGWCRIFKKYHNDPDVRNILSEFYIVAYIDYDKTPGGSDLYRRFGSTGFPSWAILDSEGVVIADCNAPMPGVKNRTYPVGYPYRENDAEYYLKVLKNTSGIRNLECETLNSKLLYYYKNH